MAESGTSTTQAGLPDEDRFPFDFELARRGTYRSYEAARPAIVTLLGRLGLPKPEVVASGLVDDGPVGRSLLRFGTDVLLNIRYYERQAHRELRKQQAMNFGIYGLSAVFFGATLFVIWNDRSIAHALSSQIAAVVAAALAGAKFVTGSWDFQKTRGSFWQAAADLKERLYHFIADWHGKAWDPAGGFRPEFVVALREEIKHAREIQGEERERFYALLASPSKLIASGGQLSSEVQASLVTYLQAEQSRRDRRRAQAIEELRKQQAELLEMYPDEKRRPAAIVESVSRVQATLGRLEAERMSALPLMMSGPGAMSILQAAALGDSSNS